MSNAAVTSHATDMDTLRALGAELIARDRWPREQLVAFQREALRRLVAQ